jgi:uncharacterized membrane protein YhhN
MTKKSKLFLFIFIAISIAHILGLALNLTLLSVYTKPFLLVSLLSYYISVSKKNSPWYIGAVVFSLIGDVMLIFEGENNFIVGLASFLIAHILYIFLVFTGLEKSSLRIKIQSILPFSIVCFGLLYFLKDNLGSLMIPVTIYAIVISLFGTISLINYFSSTSKGAITLLLGSLFFIASDSILAINKFYESKAIYALFIMVTYIIAQYLICSYMILCESAIVAKKKRHDT